MAVGRFGRPHGVRGEVRFFPYNPESELLEDGLALFVDDREDAITVKRFRAADRFLIVTLDGIGSRQDAESLRNRIASVPRSVLPDLEDDEFYLTDLIGFEVHAARTEDDTPQIIGRLKGWLDAGPTDIFAVTGPEISGRMLVPYLDHVVQNIDLQAGRITLFPLDSWASQD